MHGALPAEVGRPTNGRVSVRRRELLRAIVVVATPGVFSACADANPLAAETPAADDSARFFPQSVASGDPRPRSAVFWTRVADPERADEDLPFEFELSLDDEFREILASHADSARADADGCVKIRVTELAPDTVYYYRFAYVRDAERRRSRVGRTRTAPAADADRAVTFAVVSCQDFGGKYYHALAHAAEQGVDFFLHLGDYVYESTGDPTFQAPTAGREVVFSHPEEALDRGEGSLAARSLGNYRDLYKTYRSDPDLQRLHETVPMIAVPDDHEFSNDCYGATANYTEGRENETDLERRRNADQAWFEFMPFDHVEDPARPLDAGRAFPDDLRLYRSFAFGRHLELVVTDLRRYRPDHVVPEDAFPGSVFLAEDAARELLGAVPDDAAPYVDIDAAEHADLRVDLATHAAAQGFDDERIRGLISVPWINGIFVAAGDEAPLDAENPEFERGYAVHQLLKTAEFSSAGARYLVAEAPFSALSKLRVTETDGASERLMGDEQRRWFVDTMMGSTRTWKVWGNEYTLMPRVIDLTTINFVPPEYQQRIVLTAEDWDGAPNDRDGLLTDIAGVENVVVFTGDLHAFFAGTPHPTGAPESRVIEFVSGSVSSTTWLTGIQAAIASEPNLPPGAALIAGLVGTLLQDPASKPNPHLAWLELQRNGYALVHAGADAVEVDLVLLRAGAANIPPAELTSDVESLFTPVRFRVRAGTRELEQLIEGTYRVWDRDTMSWL